MINFIYIDINVNTVTDYEIMRNDAEKIISRVISVIYVFKMI